MNTCLDLTLLKEDRSPSLPPKLTVSKCEMRHLTVKKRHEIECFVPVIADFCHKTDTKSIIDIGCGLVSRAVARKGAGETLS